MTKIQNLATSRQSNTFQAHDRVCKATLEVLEPHAERVQPALLQPAADLLAHYGESIRTRACTFPDLHGNELFLVPDYTVPICKMHLARGGGAGRYVYAGSIFRSPESEDTRSPIEEFQTGLEIFGDSNPSQAEAEILGLAMDAIRKAGARIHKIVIGDTSLGPAVLATLPISKQRIERLQRRLGHKERLHALLERFTNTHPRSVTPERDAMLTRFHKAQDPKAEITEILKEHDIPLIGQRSAQEISRRFQELAVEREELPISAADTERVLSMLPDATPYAKTPERIRQRAIEAKIDLDAVLEKIQDQRDALLKAQIDLESIQFNAWLGHDLGYYNGFVFEIFADSPKGICKIAAGGRYDRLLKTLEQDLPAIGVAIWTQRLLDCLES